MARLSNFFHRGHVSMTSANGVQVGDTIYGVTITGKVMTGPQNFSHAFFGTGRNDFMVGGDKADWFVSGRGDDVVSGGLGDDGFFFRRGSGHDVVVDFSDNDTINISDYLAHGVKPVVTDTVDGAVIDLG